MASFVFSPTVFSSENYAVAMLYVFGPIAGGARHQLCVDSSFVLVGEYVRMCAEYGESVSAMLELLLKADSINFVDYDFGVGAVDTSIFTDVCAAIASVSEMPSRIVCGDHAEIDQCAKSAFFKNSRAISLKVARSAVCGGNVISCFDIRDMLFLSCVDLASNAHRVIYHENMYNDQICEFLRRMNLIHPEPQSRSGASATAQSSGSIDILLRDKSTQEIITHVEGMKVDSVKAKFTSICEHIHRLAFNYDRRGGYNFFVVFYTGKKFVHDWMMYQKSVQRFLYDVAVPNVSIKFKKFVLYRGATPHCAKGGVSFYEKNGCIMRIYHAFVDISPCVTASV